MATVYLARDKKLDREVALKVLRPELGAVLGSQRFLAEIKISARLDHPHILTLIDSGEADGLLYYVLPYVRGESLRSRILRERQLGLDEAVAITKQVASALDYAHRQGLVHRDIKPENILIQEGEAMLTDFGIALAVKEAGGNRLTETGLSLGTPQYMSPEQATGDRAIDARSDVYSLAAVFYEMVAGEPPVTGATAQAMIAKLMTERPTHLRVLRDTVPPGIDTAVAKALAKTPADRFATAGDFARALTAGSPADGPVVPGRRRRGLVAMGAFLVAILGAEGAYVMHTRHALPQPRAVLGLKTQLTETGDILVPAISPDGKQLAFVTKRCASGACSYAVHVQDVGGSTNRTILDGADGAYYLEWSPDRRNLILGGGFKHLFGTYLISALGGEPRLLTTGSATFYAGGDSLLLGPPDHPDSVYWIHVASLNGPVRDSIRVVGPGQGLDAISVVPNSHWIVTLVLQEPHGLWQVLDRTGKVADRVVNACTCGGIATSDAVWLARLGHGIGESVVRIALDRTNGHLSARQDTMLTGVFSNFSPTGDGSQVVIDEGTFDYSLWALGTDDLLRGRYTDDGRIAHASSSISSSISPDGNRLLVRRITPAGGRANIHFAVMPFVGGVEIPIPSASEVVRAWWADSVTVAMQSQTPTGLRLVAANVRNGAQRDAMDLPDSTIAEGTALADGWAWVPASIDRIVVSQQGHRREFGLPKGYTYLNHVAADPTGQRVFFGGGSSANDSAAVGVLSLRDGTMSTWSWVSGAVDRVVPSSGGGLVAIAELAQERFALLRANGAGPMQNVGTLPRQAFTISVSGDLKRATVAQRDYHADAWIHSVILQ